MNITRDDPALVTSIPWPRGGPLPATLGVIGIEPAELVLSAVRRSERDTLIVRFYNSARGPVSGTVSCGVPVRAIYRATMAEERQDERQQIAAFLHDDLAQLLFRLSIQVDVARKHLDAGRVDEAEEMLTEIKETKNSTSDRIRALIRDLHRSPLGRAGLREAIRGFLAEMGRDSEVRFHADIAEVDVPAPIALLLYHNAREAVTNALKHARPSNLWVEVIQEGDEVQMTVRDDGVGFDVEGPGPEGHYGLTMMRERATVASGTFAIESVPGQGTTITVRFPTSWLQEESPGPERPPAPSSVLPQADASRGTVPTPPTSATEIVPA
jgi:signal transduction histidine kinase